MERSVTLIKMHNFALLASEWRRFCCICIKSVRPEMAPKPTTATTTPAAATATKPWRLRFARCHAIYLPTTLHSSSSSLPVLFLPCRTWCPLHFSYWVSFFYERLLSSSTHPPNLHCPSLLHRPVVILLRSAFISRMSERAKGALRQPAAASFAPPLVMPAVTIKKLNTKFTLSLDGLASWQCHHCH